MEVTVHYVTLAQVPNSHSVVKLAVISAVSAINTTNHSKTHPTQYSIQRCTQKVMSEISQKIKSVI
eukprot:4048427-Amphidinium_carterae.5